MVRKIEAEVCNTVVVVQGIAGQNWIKTMSVAVNGSKWLCLVIRWAAFLGHVQSEAAKECCRRDSAFEWMQDRLIVSKVCSNSSIPTPVFYEISMRIIYWKKMLSLGLLKNYRIIFIILNGQLGVVIMLLKRRWFNIRQLVLFSSLLADSVRAVLLKL